MLHADHATSASEMAEHTFYEYQRLLQKEAEPELIIQLPDRIVGNTGEAAGQPMDSVDAKEQAKAEIAVTVAFALQQPTCGIHFHGQYAFTDAQVSQTAMSYCTIVCAIHAALNDATDLTTLPGE